MISRPIKEPYKLIQVKKGSYVVPKNKVAKVLKALSLKR